jgi:hypothetical protein
MKDRVTEMVDVFWFIDHYRAAAKRQGIPVNRALYL